LTKLESNGWKVIVVHDGNDALRLLQMRNWDAVLIDDDLPVIAGTPCVTKFREWEQSNRVNRQQNVCLVCDGDIPSPGDKASVIQPPAGIDGVLRKPVQWKDLNYFIKRAKKDTTNPTSVGLNAPSFLTTKEAPTPTSVGAFLSTDLHAPSSRAG
jgi:CheY-like chemotaxis protein